MSNSSNLGTLSGLRPVFKTGMAFVIPLERVRASVSRKITHTFKPNADYVNNFNVRATYLPLDKNAGLGCAAGLPGSINFDSRPEGRGKVYVRREAKVSFYLLRYAFKGVNRPECVLVMLAELDFATNGSQDYDFITPHDIICLKNTLLAANGAGYTTIREIVSDIMPAGFQRKSEIKVKGTVINVRAAITDSRKPRRDTLAKDLYSSFYLSGDRPVTISSFLKTNMSGYMRPHDTTCSDMERWVYGLLHNNDNFMMADDSVIADNVRTSYYSNNFVERYWASPSTVLTVKVASPFLETEENGCRHDDFCDFDSLTETCLLITLGRKINKLLSRHDSMKYQEVEKRKAEIASCFSYTVMNLIELDRKLQFFIRRSNLHERYESVLRIVTPRRNVIEKYRSEFIALLSIAIAFLTLIITLLKQ
ncbi:MAG: hypothetical protein K2N28_07715 [Muribaculaceae bacterium]|nr:hypothetical protein [Muribaculaceae bacterium]